MPIARNIYIRNTHLSDVNGRIDYISNPRRQEYLYAVYNTATPFFWHHLAEQNRRDFKMSGASGKCIEARELVIALPESFTRYDPDLLLKYFVEVFYEKYETHCVGALHHNKTKTNYHIHLIYSERKVLDKAVEKIASRNMFYDEHGKHVRTKKEILDEDGNIRKGCSIVRKGEIYERRLLTAKDPVFKSPIFIPEIKKMYCDRINYFLSEENQMTIFDPDGPYLPTKKIGKNNPMADKIRSDNEARKQWNQKVDEALSEGMPAEDIRVVKMASIMYPAQKNISKNGDAPGILTALIYHAIYILQRMLNQFLAASTIAEKQKRIETLKLQIQETQMSIDKMKKISGELYGIQKDIDSKKKKLRGLNREYDDVKDSIFFHARKKKELSSQIHTLEQKIADAESRYELKAQMHGYSSAEEFYQEYRKQKDDLNIYQKEMEKLEEPMAKIPETVSVKSAEVTPAKKKSIHERLNENRDSVDQRKRTGSVPDKKNKKHDPEL